MREAMRKAQVISACLSAFLLLGLAGGACEEPLGIAVEGFAYPHPVHMFVIQAGGERLSMAYMDVPPEGDSNGRIEGSKKQRTEETP